MTLAQARKSIGRTVTYRPCGDCGWGERPGVITRLGARCVYVRLEGDGHETTASAGRLFLKLGQR